MIKLVSDTIDKSDIKSLTEWLNQDITPRLTKGDLTWELEKKWAKKIGTRFSVFVNSGSSAILLTLAAMKESGKLENNKVVVPALSWATDVSSPMLLGYDVHMCDCNLHDLSCDLVHLEELFEKERPASFILVSPLGLVPNMTQIVDLCNRYGVKLLEDVCESMGSKYNERHLGTFGLASFHSMYFGHHLSTIEGGFISTDDIELYHLLLMMRSHGWDRDLPLDKQKELRDTYKVSSFNSLYNFYVPGLNVRSTDLQAFIGIRAIDKLDTYSAIRRANFITYSDNITGNILSLRENQGDFISSFAFPIVHKKRDEIVKELIDNGIEIRPLIAGNMANKPMWFNKHVIPSLPNCEIVDEFGFYVPNHQDLTQEEINNICSIVNKYTDE
jgi:CDP-6-deoxy-D-xylo-4-hexulose-3-dehydrase|tara:strand:+ start:1579 stop:2739 length:1161 start_codon:yes stop_codon:yes gene_type:complete